jgi:hypothetical protein
MQSKKKNKRNNNSNGSQCPLKPTEKLRLPLGYDFFAKDSNGIVNVVLSPKFSHFLQQMIKTHSSKSSTPRTSISLHLSITTTLMGEPNIYLSTFSFLLTC